MATFSDDFNRADSADLGANWTPLAVGTDAQIVSQRVRPTAGTGVGYELATVSLGNDHFARLTIATYTGPGVGRIGVMIRVADTNNRYIVFAHKNAGGLSTDLFKLVAGVYSSLASEGATTWAAGDTIELRASGTALVVLRNGATLLSTVDGDFSSGSVGLVLDDAVSAADTEAESFVAGDTVTTITATGGSQLLTGVAPIPRRGSIIIPVTP